MAQEEHITPTAEMIGNVVNKFGYSNLIGMKIVTIHEGIERQSPV